MRSSRGDYRRDSVRSADLLEFAIDQANDGIAIMELTGDSDVPMRIVYANETLERFTGFGRDELLSPLNPLLQTQPQNRSRYDDLLKEVRGGRSVSFEIELTGKDRATWCEIRWSPVRYDGGVVTHYVAVLRDITERRRAQAERDMLYRAIEASSDYVAMYDAAKPSDGGPHVTYANGAFRHALGYTQEEIIGKPYGQLLAPDNDPRLLESLVRMIESSQPIEKEMRLLRRDGTAFWAEVTGYPVRGAEMREHWFVLARDISGHKETIRNTAIVTRALDALPFPIRIYDLEGGRHVGIFRNAAADEPACGDERDGGSLVTLYDMNGVAEALVSYSLPALRES
jgi:PAS domain S-box-containing protein